MTQRAHDRLGDLPQGSPCLLAARGMAGPHLLKRGEDTLLHVADKLRLQVSQARTLDLIDLTK